MTRILRQLLAGATCLFEEASILTPAKDARLLAAHVLGCSLAELALKIAMSEEMTTEQQGAFAHCVEQRRMRVPVQHLTGKAPFRYRELTVGPGVFIPRPETELLVDLVLENLATCQVASPIVIDACAGSGAIAGAVATEWKQALVYAVEISDEAIDYTQINLAGTGATVIHGDMASALRHLEGTVDVVVTNPPYLPPDAVPQDIEVLLYDPDIALYGQGEDGLKVPYVVMQRALALLKPGGFFVMEHAEVQKEKVHHMLASTQKWRGINCHQDLNDRPRAITAYKS